jgi:hypothetical protein
MLLPTQRKAVLTIRFLSEIEKEIYLYPVFYCEELLPVQFVVAFVVFVTPFADPKIIFVLPSCFLIGFGVTIFK